MARTLKVCFITACFATLSAICASFIPAQLVDINDPTPAFITLTGFIALTLFFGGGLIPSATGILVIAVSVELRELSSAGSMFFFQLFGYALSPLVSSIVMQAQPHTPPRQTTAPHPHRRIAPHLDAPHPIHLDAQHPTSCHPT